ncbi:hypothetical protein EJ110_NYTH54198, partial [Nymphaea thermarum]
YQNYLSERASIYLLELLKPNLVLSGHDHDQCTVTHTAKHGPVREVILIGWDCELAARKPISFLHAVVFALHAFSKCVQLGGFCVYPIVFPSKANPHLYLVNLPEFRLRCISRQCIGVSNKFSH